MCTPFLLRRERRPPPAIEVGKPVSAVYADNLNVVGGCKDDSIAAVDSFVKALEAMGIGCHGIRRCEVRLDTLGLVIDFAAKDMSHAPPRIWRFVLGTRALLRRRSVDRLSLDAWLGHAVCIAAKRRSQKHSPINEVEGSVDRVT